MREQVKILEEDFDYKCANCKTKTDYIKEIQRLDKAAAIERAQKKKHQDEL